jgi:hypothetical protein
MSDFFCRDCQPPSAVPPAPRPLALRGAAAYQGEGRSLVLLRMTLPMTDPAPDVPEAPLPPEAQFLKRLVIVMTVVLVAGFVTLIAALVIRLNAEPLPMPDRISLPDGVAPYAFTQGVDWFAVVTSDNRILIYDRATGVLRQTVAVE